MKIRRLQRGRKKVVHGKNEEVIIWTHYKTTMNERGGRIGGLSLKGTVAGAPGRFGAYNHASWLVPSAQWSSRVSNASLPCALVLSSPCCSRFLRTRNLIIFLARDRLPGGSKNFPTCHHIFPSHQFYLEICSRSIFNKMIVGAIDNQKLNL